LGEAGYSDAQVKAFAANRRLPDDCPAMYARKALCLPDHFPGAIPRLRGSGGGSQQWRNAAQFSH